MSESNKALAARFYREVLGGGNVDAIDDLFSTDYVGHEPLGDSRLTTKAWFEAFGRAFLDRNVVVDEPVAMGDFVLCHYYASLWHVRPFMGFEPSMAKLEISGVGVFRCEGGKIVERWNQEEGLGLILQLKLLSRSTARELATV